MSIRYKHECPEGCKVFIGNLDRHLTSDQIREVFSDFGRVRGVWLATNPPGFGFVMFKHKSDAKQAVKKMNNQMLSGRPMTVELATGSKRNSEGRRMNPKLYGPYYRPLASRDNHPNRVRQRSPNGGQTNRKTIQFSGGYGDRYFYSSDYKRTASPSNRDHLRTDTDHNRHRTRGRERLVDKQVQNDKSRRRGPTTDL